MMTIPYSGNGSVKKKTSPNMKSENTVCRENKEHSLQREQRTQSAERTKNTVSRENKVCIIIVRTLDMQTFNRVIIMWRRLQLNKPSSQARTRTHARTHTHTYTHAHTYIHSSACETPPQTHTRRQTQKIRTIALSACTPTYDSNSDWFFVCLFNNEKIFTKVQK